MKNIRMLITVALFGITILAMGQQPSIKITSQGELQVIGITNRYHQFQSSINMVDWSSFGSYFNLLNSSFTQVIDTELEREFFRVRALPEDWVVMNNSIRDNCAERDNVSFVFRQNVTNYSIIATHPTNYLVTDYTCFANFNNCGTANDTNYSFSPSTWKTDFGSSYMIAERQSLWWRPQGMTYFVDGLLVGTNIHILKVGKRIPGTSEWPQYFVLYSDGYMRLIPFPPTGHSSVCFGSSVIVGPAKVSARPYVDIEWVNLISSQQSIHIKYRDGGEAILDFSTVSRTSATVNVTVMYPTDQSLCTFRSMYVSDGNSDCDHVVCHANGVITTNSIMSFSGTTGTNLFFYRQTPSIQRPSASDIRIILK